MQPIRSIIIDDEPLARKGLKEYINDVDFLQLEGESDNPLKATKLLSEGNIQLIFLDIQMPKITGLEFFKTLHNAPPVIFTTAYPQYALDGFELNALDYLVKPISFERFLKASMRAKEYYEVRNKNLEEQKTAGKDDFFFVKADNKLVKIFLDDILYVEALQNYVSIHTKTKKFITYLTFKSIEEYLASDRFIKTHKSYIVSASKIDNIEGNDIRIGDHHIPISRTSKDEVMERLLKGRFLKR
ncbi:MAG TPA: LytTR family DNA-binding domain-containing protein [Flavisolibacter sp.]|jgi:DNA-binding LytR/AlgR family response regulator|nr:LytTR family DNA-binding domain-containing protein [Flavisolibacter sp.]